MAVGYALYLRYQVIEQSAVGIACETAPATWLCSSRRTAILLFTPSAFGAVAIVAALLNLVRPSIVLCTITVIAAGFGIVLYNVALSAFAVALLILSLARSAPEPD
jgi:multisubunit Na+/H+ antiporter MnhE subunit